MTSKTSQAATPKSIALDKLVTEKNFRITSDWASPTANSSLNAIANSGLLGAGNTAGNINLMGNTNFLKIKGDSIQADLPYYGERQMGGSYSSNDSGIKFNAIPTTFKSTKNENTLVHTISFQISGDTNEHYNITLSLSPNWTTEIMVSSSQRTSIRFRGTISEIANIER